MLSRYNELCKYINSSKKQDKLIVELSAKIMKEVKKLISSLKNDKEI